MFNWLTSTDLKKNRKPGRPSLRLEELEAREVPALTVQIDYSLDTSGFFNDPTHRAILQQAVNDEVARLDAPTLGALAPGGGNSWTASVFNPSTGALQNLSNPSIGADTILVYAGGRNLTGSEAGVGGFGGYSASGNSAWVNYVGNRGTGGFGPWGGSLAFDTVGTPWYFGSSSSVPGSEVDFYSVVQHELGHLLGIGTATQWFSQVSGGTFHGAAADATYGGAVPVYGDNSHWADGLTYNGQAAVMDPILNYGTRRTFTALDYAALHDIGWAVTSGLAPVSPPAPASPPAAVSPPPPAALPPVVNNRAHGPDIVAVSGGAGWFQVFAQGGDNVLHPISGQIHPFAGFGGEIRTAVGDFNGDGTEDVAVATGAGTVAQVAIYNGRDMSLLLAPTSVLGGFSGGAFLAAGDILANGRDQLAVSADFGGTPRVTVYTYVNGQIYGFDDFYAFDAPTFRGGVRVAIGDVNRDGFADLVVTAGPGGGPRVSTYDGRSVAAGGTGKLFNDFYAYDPNLRTGAFVAVGDINGDGYAEIVFSADVGGSSRTIAYSGYMLTTHPGIDPMTLPFLFSQYATPENLPEGTRVTLKDLNGDGREEMLFTTAARTDSTIRVITSAQILSGSQPNPQVGWPIGNAADGNGLYVG